MEKNMVDFDIVNNLANQILHNLSTLQDSVRSSERMVDFLVANLPDNCEHMTEADVVRYAAELVLLNPSLPRSGYNYIRTPRATVDVAQYETKIADLTEALNKATEQLQLKEDLLTNLEMRTDVQPLPANGTEKELDEIPPDLMEKYRYKPGDTPPGEFVASLTEGKRLPKVTDAEVSDVLKSIGGTLNEQTRKTQSVNC